MKLRLRTATLQFVLAPILVIGFAVNSSSQSLGDVARAERERQRRIQSAVTYSNDAATTTTPAPDAAASPGARVPEKKPESAAEKPAGPLDNKGHDEKYWRAAFQTARDGAKRAEDRVQLAELKLKDLNLMLLRQSDVYNREYVLGPMIITAQADLDSARKTAQQAKQKIADLEEELRRSAGLPGWAR